MALSSLVNVTVCDRFLVLQGQRGCSLTWFYHPRWCMFCRRKQLRRSKNHKQPRTLGKKTTDLRFSFQSNDDDVTAVGSEQMSYLLTPLFHSYCRVSSVQRVLESYQPELFSLLSYKSLGKFWDWALKLDWVCIRRGSCPIPTPSALDSCLDNYNSPLLFLRIEPPLFLRTNTKRQFKSDRPQVGA